MSKIRRQMIYRRPKTFRLSTTPYLEAGGFGYIQTECIFKIKLISAFIVYANQYYASPTKCNNFPSVLLVVRYRYMKHAFIKCSNMLLSSDWNSMVEAIIYNHKRFRFVLFLTSSWLVPSNSDHNEIWSFSTRSNTRIKIELISCCALAMGAFCGSWIKHCMHCMCFWW